MADSQTKQIRPFIWTACPYFLPIFFAVSGAIVLLYSQKNSDRVMAITYIASAPFAMASAFFINRGRRRLAIYWCIGYALCLAVGVLWTIKLTLENPGAF